MLHIMMCVCACVCLYMYFVGILIQRVHYLLVHIAYNLIAAIRLYSINNTPHKSDMHLQVCGRYTGAVILAP